MSALRVAAAALLVALAPGARAGAATPLETAREARAAVLATALPSVADAPTVNELRGAFIAALNEESRLHGALEEAYLRATAAAPEAERPAILVELLEVELALAKRMQTAARELLQPNAELVRMREPLVVYVREKAARVQKGLARCPEAVAACAGVRRELAALSGASAPEEDVARCVLATPLRGGRVFADAAGKQPIGTIAAELPATLAPAARRGGASEVRVAALEGPVWIPGGGGYVLRRELDVVAGGFVALRHGAEVTLSRAGDGEVVVRADLGPGATPRRVEAKLACEDLVAAPLAVLGGGIGAGGGQVALKPGTPLYDAPGGKRVAVLGFREAGERGGVATAMRQEGAWVSVVGGTTSLAFHGWVKSAAARPWSWGPAGHEDNAPRAELARPPEPTRVFTPAVEPLPLRLSATGPIVARAARAALVRVTERTETALTLEIKGLEAANADGRFIVRLADLEGGAVTRHAAVVLAAFVASFAGAAAVAAEPGEVPLAVARGERAALLAAPIPTAADGTTGDAHSETERRLTYERMRAAYSEAITHTPLPAKRDVWVELAEAELEVAARELRIADEHLAPDEASRPSRGQLGLAIEDHHRAAVASLATCREAGACDGTEAAAAIAFFYDRILRRPQSDRPTDRSVTPTPLPAIRLFADAGGRRLIGTVAGYVKGALDEPARRGAQAIVVEILAGPESDPLFIAREDASQLADTPPAAERGPSPGGFAPANEALPLRLSPRGPVVACTASAAWIRVVERTDELARIELEGVRAASRDGLFVVRLADLTYDWRAPWACRRAKQK